jgi:hypothetical protein
VRKGVGANGRRDSSARAAIEYDDMDDVVYLADHEVGRAPDDPGTYEGGHAKPMHPSRHNKWCVRECERSNIVGVGEEIKYPDFRFRRYNQPWLHEEAKDHNRMIDVGETFTVR